VSRGLSGQDAALLLLLLLMLLLFMSTKVPVWLLLAVSSSSCCQRGRFAGGWAVDVILCGQRLLTEGGGGEGLPVDEEKKKGFGDESPWAPPPSNVINHAASF
jgi:hypothetical protein